MKKVALVTDSTACIPPEIARDLDITVVPIWVLFGEQAYRDGVDITPDEFYARLKTADPLPHTSSPSLGDYLKVFENLRQEADSILVITYSSHFGMSYQAARIAGDQIEGVRVEVLDSRTATMAQGFVAIIAARAIARGADLETAIAVAELDTGEWRVLDVGDQDDRSPRWSPDGSALAFVSDRSQAGDFQTYLTDFDGEPSALAPVDGIVEYLSWSPDGGRLLLGVAGRGADHRDGESTAVHVCHQRAQRFDHRFHHR